MGWRKFDAHQLLTRADAGRSIDPASGIRLKRTFDTSKLDSHGIGVRSRRASFGKMAITNFLLRGI